MVLIANSCDKPLNLESYRIKVINKPYIIHDKLKFNFMFLDNKLCGIILSYFNECTPTGKGEHSDWGGACYIKLEP